MDITFNEISETQKDRCHVILLAESMSPVVKFTVVEGQGGCQEPGKGGNWGLLRGAEPQFCKIEFWNLVTM